MLYRLIIICILFISCKEKQQQIPNLNPDPLQDAYVNNRIGAYVKTYKYNDSIIRQDSVCVNKKGYITEILRLKGYALHEKYEYDSLDRIKRYKHDSDIHFINNYTYKVEYNKKQVVQLNNGIPTSYYKFDKNFERLQEVISIKDTIWTSLYLYINGKISAIKSEDKNTPFRYYKYDEHNRLDHIVVDRQEVQYISRITGLINSIKPLTGKDEILIKYYKQ